MDTNKESTPKGKSDNLSEDYERQIEAHEEEKLLDAHQEDEKFLPEAQEDVPAAAKPESAAGVGAAAVGAAAVGAAAVGAAAVGAASAAGASAKAAASAPVTDTPKVEQAPAAEGPAPIEEPKIETPIAKHNGWANAILAILCIIGAFMAGYLIYCNYQGHKIEEAQYANNQQPSKMATDVNSTFAYQSTSAPAGNSKHVQGACASKSGAASLLASGTPTAALAVPVAVVSGDTTETKDAAMQPMLVYLFPIDNSKVVESRQLNAIAKNAIDNGKVVVLKGYTDESGSRAYNEKLSENRAKAVGKYLANHGVPRNHIVTKGEGPSHKYPTAQQNRRVEVSLK